MERRRIAQIPQHCFFRAAIAAGQDAADRQMKAAGRNHWNAEDVALAAAVTRRLLEFAAGPEIELPRMAA
jgi:hypothetical protein